MKTSGRDVTTICITLIIMYIEITRYTYLNYRNWENVGVDEYFPEIHCYAYPLPSWCAEKR